MSEIELDDVCYRVDVRGDGPPLALLHGFTGSGESWGAVVDAFAAQFRVLAVDLLGHGQTSAPSEPARYRLERAAADLVAVFTALNAVPLHLLGYSMGGRLALGLALQFPQVLQTLILESASPGLATDAERQARIASDTALAERIERDGIAAFVDEWERLPLFASQPDHVRARLHALRLKNNPTGLAHSLRGMGTGAQPPLWGRLGQVQVPTLLIAGALDAKFVAIGQQMEAALPNARFALIDGAGHTTHAEQPAAFVEVVEEFLKRKAI